jgi:hypothetical protein
MMDTTPRFLNGVFPFEGKGLDAPYPLADALAYTVPADKRAQLIYLRAGNSSDGLVSLTLMRDGKPMRLFPVGARAALHVPLAVVEDISPEAKIEVFLAAPQGASGQVVLDIGLMEV